jgi:hypothetical protein
VCRPATAILKKLVLSGPAEADGAEQGRIIGDGEASGSAAAARTAPHAYRFGFEAVYHEIEKEPAFLSTLLQRLGSPDTTLCLYRCVAASEEGDCAC